MNNLAFDLQKVGFDEREARVYLACLELGPSPVQKIAQRAETPRATVYLVLDDLQNKGVVTTYEEGKKTYYVAEPPQKIADLVDEKALKVKQQQETLKKLIPELTSRGQFEKGEKSLIKYYEGAQAVGSFIRDSLAGEGGEVLNLFHFDRAMKMLEQTGTSIEKIRERRSVHKIKSRVIYTTDNGPIDGYSTKERDTKFVPFEEFPFEADITIRGNRTIFIPYGLPLRGVAVEDEAITNTLRMIFEIMWSKID